MITRFRIQHCRVALWVALVSAAALSAGIAAWAEEPTTEETRLATLLRQLDTLERLAEQSAERSATTASRYHFDYARLHTDIARIRTGIEDYLSPIRAQPRDPQALSGQYRRDEDTAP